MGSALYAVGFVAVLLWLFEGESLSDPFWVDVVKFLGALLWPITLAVCFVLGVITLTSDLRRKG